MEALGLALQGSKNFDTLHKIGQNPKVFRSHHLFREIQRVLHETDLLRVIVEESAFDLDRLQIPAPRSAIKALEQCVATSHELARELSVFEDPKLPRTVTYLSDWVPIRRQVKDLLDAFRISAGLLREISSESVSTKVCWYLVELGADCGQCTYS
jgi:hypothetical protein